MYRYYVFGLDFFHILWCQPVLGFTNVSKFKFKYVGPIFLIYSRNICIPKFICQLETHFTYVLFTILCMSTGLGVYLLQIQTARCKANVTANITMQRVRNNISSSVFKRVCQHKTLKYTILPINYSVLPLYLSTVHNLTTAYDVVKLTQ
jgi:hypothetical protein